MLLLPLQQVFLLQGGALLTLWLGWRRTSGTLLALSLLWLFCCASPLVADALMNYLERDYPPRSATSLPAAEVMVVLGGSTRGDTSLEQPADLNGQADRLVFAAQLFRNDKAPLLLLSGGSAGHLRPEAEEMAEVLTAMGLPPEALLLEPLSRNTYENAFYSAQLLQQRGVDRVLLVTSAFHMRRAQKVFEAQGIEVVPAATDYQLLRHATVLPPLLPSLQALGRTTYAVREIAGILVYQWRGYF